MKKKISLIYYTAAALFFLAAIIGLFNGNTTQGIIMMCLGSSQLCLGSVWLSKSRKAEKGLDSPLRAEDTLTTDSNQTS